MPEAKVLPFRVIDGGRVAEVAPVPESDALETLRGALEVAGTDGWEDVVIIFRTEGQVDTCYSTMTDQERLYLMEYVKTHRLL